MNKEVLATDNAEQVDELCENIEVVGPGLMLSEARKKLSLSVEDVSSRLNFRTNLINEIEKDVFDPLLPATFNRGYLRSYAKLVGVDADEVLSAYDMLSVAEEQRSEMQSFSNLTEKQAEHSRLMWFSYLIVALLFGLVVVWWLQEPKLPVDFFKQTEQSVATEQEQSSGSNDVIVNVPTETASPDVPAIEKAVETKSGSITEVVAKAQKEFEQTITEETPSTAIVSKVIASTVESEVEEAIELVPELSTVVFTFLGDCWVNIYDATGERIAWGVKKSDYIMTVTGKTPLKVTLGKPELATIVFNGEQVDMSSFSAGNIAKFTLPLVAQ